jgi:hypothetical protein
MRYINKKEEQLTRYAELYNSVYLVIYFFWKFSFYDTCK